MKENQRIEDFSKSYTFEKNNKLGVGSFGQVRKATHIETGEIRAIKMIDKK